MEPTNITPEQRVEATVETAASVHNALTPEEIDDHKSAMHRAKNLDELAAAFTSAQQHANLANDKAAKLLFGTCKDACKSALLNPDTAEVL